ncbi:MAG: efflux RND transporter periplasmic adaptor subunit [Gammaproteobacteria bacterium]|nr:efflux RND transporter periplasmic adaptor subunit [Gammaproteobacteria bacterium]
MDHPTVAPDDKQGEAAVDVDDFLGRKPRKPYVRYLTWAAGVVGLLLLAWIAFRVFGAGEAAPRFATAPVERGDLRVTVTATGNLAPTNQVDVGTEISGTVTRVDVDNNDRVTQGQVLARIDTSRLEDAVNQSRAALQSSQAQVALAEATVAEERADLARLEEVYKLSGGRVPAAAELDAARAAHERALANLRVARAAVAQARAQLSSNQTQLSKAIIRSPVNGVVLSRQIEPGQTVAASLNAPVLFTIAESLGQMQLEVKVDEADVGQVREGQKASFEVDAFPGREFEARVQRVDVGANATGSSSASSSASSTSSGQVVSYTAVLTVANPELILRPGMTATADIVTGERNNVLLVPNAALRFTPAGAAGSRPPASGGVTSVLVPRGPRGNRAASEREVGIGRGSRQTLYVLGADGQAQPLMVTVGESNGSETEVTGNELREGMQVVTGQLAARAQR